MYSQLVMLLFLVAVLVGVTVGLAMNAFNGRTMGDTYNTLRLTLKTPTTEIWILGVGVLGTALASANLLGSGEDSNLGLYVLAGSLVCVSYGAFCNWHFTGMSLIALGAGLNLLALLLFGYLPVDPQALVTAGIIDSDSLYRVVLGTGRQLYFDDSILAQLGPVIGIRWISKVISLGDLIIVMGVGNVCLRLLWPMNASLRPAAAPAEQAGLEQAGLEQAGMGQTGIGQTGIRQAGLVEGAGSAAPNARTAS